MRKIIFGTDWGTDCDDAVALRLLTNAHKKGIIELSAIVINNCRDCSVQSLDGFLTLERMEKLPIGIDFDATDYEGPFYYQERLVPFAKNYKSNVDAKSAVRVYRETLANSDEKAEIIEVGFLQALAALIESPADDISPLTGEELVKEKVKRIWSMAGRWDIDGGFEYNFANNMRARMGAYTVLEKCPVPITFLGWEVGADVITGGKLDNSDHLYNVLLDYKHPNGRMSWDPMLTLLAITNDNEKAGYATVYGKGSIEIESGKNHFEKDEKGIHSFVVKTKENEYYENEINRIISNGF